MLKTTLCLILMGLIFLFTTSSCITVQEASGSQSSFPSGNKEVSFVEREVRQGSQVERTYNLNFNRVDLDVPMDTEIIFSRRPRVVVSAVPGILERLVVEENYGELKMYLTGGFTKYRASDVMLVRIYVNELMALRSSKRVKFLGKVIQPELEIVTDGGVSGDFEVDNMVIETNGLGSFKGSIWGNHLRVHALGNSNIDLSGRVGGLSMEAIYSGKIDGKALNAENAILETTHSGRISLSVSQEVQASAKDKSEIHIFKTGNPEIFVEEEGRGAVMVY